MTSKIKKFSLRTEDPIPQNRMKKSSSFTAFKNMFGGRSGKVSEIGEQTPDYDESEEKKIRIKF